MKVYIWTGGHTNAETLILDPPRGIEIESNYKVDQSQMLGGLGERIRTVPTTLRLTADAFSYGVGLPRTKVILSDADVVHTISGIVPMPPRSWVSTISLPSSFFGLRPEWTESWCRPKILKRIIRTHHCKRILCISASTLEGLVASFASDGRNEISEKLSVLYPAVNIERFKRRRANSGVFRVLFVGNLFFDKGGRELFRAISCLSRKYDICVDMVADAPPHHRRLFNEFVKKHNEKWVRWHIPGVPRRALVEEFYPQSDVFVMCSYVDIFGYVFLEAMAAGLPIIGANVYAQREIIQHGYNGYLVKIPVSCFEGHPQIMTTDSVARYRYAVTNESLFEDVSMQLETHLEEMINNTKLTNSMSLNSLNMTSEGKFGVKHRNRILRRIYEEAATT